MGADEEKLKVVREALKQKSRLSEIVALAGQRVVIDEMLARQRDSETPRVVQEMERHEKMVRAAAGPLEQMRRSGIIDQASAMSREIAMARA